MITSRPGLSGNIEAEKYLNIFSADTSISPKRRHNKSEQDVLKIAGLNIHIPFIQLDAGLNLLSISNTGLPPLPPGGSYLNKIFL
jgi:hypothetical protein